jgi:hypothetical protein
VAAAWQKESLREGKRLFVFFEKTGIFRQIDD